MLSQFDLDIFLCDDNKPYAELREINKSTFKQRRSTYLAELNKKYNTKIKRRSGPYRKNKEKVKQV